MLLTMEEIKAQLRLDEDFDEPGCGADVKSYDRDPQSGAEPDQTGGKDGKRHAQYLHVVAA